MTIGVLFALTNDDEAKLFACPEDERPDLIGNDIEERYTEEFSCDTDKSWDAIHRAFNNSMLNYDFSEDLQGVILGGEPLFGGNEYIISYKTRAEVKRIAKSLSSLDLHAFRTRYFAIRAEEYGEKPSEDDFNYSWNNLVDLVQFYSRSATANRSVIFTASQ